MGNEPERKLYRWYRLYRVEGIVLLVFLGIVAMMVITVIFQPHSLNAQLCNVLPRLEKEISILKGAETNIERLRDLEELKGLIEARFQKTGFQPDKAPYEPTGTLEDHLRFALASLEGEMDIYDPKGYNPSDDEPAPPPGAEKELREPKRMKALIEQVLDR